MEDGKWPLVPDVKNLSIYVNSELATNAIYTKLLDELKKAEKDHENVENVLSFIRGLLEVAKGGMVRGLTEDDLISLDELVCKKIGEKIDVQLPESTSSIGQALNRI
jgi:hypothetical protein